MHAVQKRRYIIRLQLVELVARLSNYTQRSPPMIHKVYKVAFHTYSAHCSDRTSNIISYRLHKSQYEQLKLKTVIYIFIFTGSQVKVGRHKARIECMRNAYKILVDIADKQSNMFIYVHISYPKLHQECEILNFHVYQSDYVLLGYDAVQVGISVSQKHSVSMFRLKYISNVCGTINVVRVMNLCNKLRFILRNIVIN